MRKIIFLLLISQLIFSQEIKKATKIDFSPYFRVNCVFPFQTGNHSLAKDFDSNFGYNANLSLISYGKLNLNFGYEFIKYNIINPSNIGNINHLNYSVIYFEFDYDFEVYKNLKLIPTIGFGYVKNNYKTKNRSFGVQEGSELRLGNVVNYNLNNTFSIFIGFHYIFTNLNINTNKEFENYFGKANRLQLSFGIKFE